MTESEIKPGRARTSEENRAYRRAYRKAENYKAYQKSDKYKAYQKAYRKAYRKRRKDEDANKEEKNLP